MAQPPSFADSIISNGNFPPVLMLFGEETMLVNEAARTLYAAAQASDEGGMSTEIIDGDTISLEAVLSLARSYPMMAERRTIWIRRFEKVAANKSKVGDALAEYLSNPMPTTFLLLTASIPFADGIGAAMQKNAKQAQKKIATMKFPYNLLLAQAPWVEYQALTARELTSWIRTRALDKGLELTPHVVEYLLVRYGHSLYALDQEINKLVSYCHGRGSVSEVEMMRIAGGSRTYSVFDLQKAIGAGNIQRAMTILQSLLDESRQELVIVAMLVKYFLTLFKLSDAITLGDRNAIGSAVGIPPFAVADHIDALQRLGVRRVEQALMELRTTERLLKSTSADPGMLLETVLLTIMSDHSSETAGIPGVNIFAS